MPRLYEVDFAGWADETAKLLSERRFEEIDLDALIEEVEGLAASDRRAYRSHLAVALEHLLKLAYAHDETLERNGRGWRQSVSNARDAIRILLSDSPSAARDRDAAFLAAFDDARRRLVRNDDDLPVRDWPEACPWTLEQVLDEEYWPTAGHGKS